MNETIKRTAALDEMQLTTQAAAMFRGLSTAEAMAAGWRCRETLERGESPAAATAEARS